MNTGARAVVRPSTIVVAFLPAVLFTSPLFPPSSLFGFYSAELSFFGLAALLMYGALLTFVLRSELVIQWDRSYVLLAVFLLLAVLSLVDAVGRLRALLFLGQYLPYFFVFVLVINVVRSQEILERVLRALIWLTAAFAITFVAVQVLLQTRLAINQFLLAQFVISLNKVLTYIELPLCVLMLMLVRRRATPVVVGLAALNLLVVVLTGSRGSFAVLVGLIFLIGMKAERRGHGLAVTVVSVLLIVAGLGLSSYALDRLEKSFVTSQRQFEDNMSLFSRVFTGYVAWSLMVQHPVNGIGIGNSKYFIQKTALGLGLPAPIIEKWTKREFFETTTTPLKLGSELGVGGFAFYVVFYAYLWRRVRRALGVASGSMRFLLHAMEVYVITAFAHNLIDLGFMNYYSWFYYGLVIAATRIAMSPAPVTDHAVRSPWIIAPEVRRAAI